MLKAQRNGICHVLSIPSAQLPEERGISIGVLFAHPDGALLDGLLARVAAGELPARVQAVVPLAEAADAYRMMATKSVRGRIVLVP